MISRAAAQRAEKHGECDLCGKEVADFTLRCASCGYWFGCCCASDPGRFPSRQGCIDCSEPDAVVASKMKIARALPASPTNTF